MVILWRVGRSAMCQTGGRGWGEYFEKKKGRASLPAPGSTPYGAVTKASALCQKTKCCLQTIWLGGQWAADKSAKHRPHYTIRLSEKRQENGRILGQRDKSVAGVDFRGIANTIPGDRKPPDANRPSVWWLFARYSRWEFPR